MLWVWRAASLIALAEPRGGIGCPLHSCEADSIGVIAAAISGQQIWMKLRRSAHLCGWDAYRGGLRRIASGWSRRGGCLLPRLVSRPGMASFLRAHADARGRAYRR